MRGGRLSDTADPQLLSMGGLIEGHRCRLI
jgi:hypothetical protein